ncbi:MAG: nitroreductase family protein [Candidatus Cyclobacteriaceae bacterium M3_2C_046]
MKDPESSTNRFLPYTPELPNPDRSLAQSAHFYREMDKRRSVRRFSDRPVAREVIENIIKTASTAPSGANKQPWTFCVVSDLLIKKKIREAAEQEEKVNYAGRMNEQWQSDIAHLGTDWQKPFLEVAPWLIIVFKQSYGESSQNRKIQHYYVNESVGLACGFLLAAIHQAGLVSLTHTPSPMNFLSQILDRPANEKPFLLIPVGYPAPDATVPDIGRKPLEQVSCFFE